MKKVLITFGDDNYTETRERFCNEAVALGVFDEVVGFGPHQLGPDFRAKHKRFCQLHPRGYGYWIWKPHVISTTLQTLSEGDVLIYADAGCGIEPKNVARLAEYVDRVRAHPSGILAFELPRVLNRVFIKMDVFEALNAHAYAGSPMLMATVITIRKCAASLKFVRDLESYCGEYRLISDQPSALPNHPDFQMNMGDQSIFSLLGRLGGVDVIPDETWGAEARSPILAKRLRPRLGFGTKLKRSFLKRRAAIAWRLGLGR